MELPRTRSGHEKRTVGFGPITLRRVVTLVLLAVAGASLYLASALHDDSLTGGARSRVVKTVSPRPGSIQLRQTEILVELDSGYSGELLINGTLIPDDQLSIVQGLNRITYTPRAGREVEVLPAGHNCAVVRFRPVAGSTGQPGSYRWCFSVQ
ncbi:MAG: hypothetical protein M3396_00180 [Actinomycetota bacterium]|nr:hypothetical protein [Actinomycetota bacterium]MDQ3574984.1 hypothetical protein [Actinomycetota bacterium]